MNTDAKIQALVEQAAPLRKLADGDKAKEALAGIVDEINALRAWQAGEAFTAPLTTLEGADALDDDGAPTDSAHAEPAEVAPQPEHKRAHTHAHAHAEIVKRGPGRPKKAD